MKWDASVLADLPIEGHLGSFDGATQWLNSPPLTTADLAGRVVLVDFWTFTCINWIRTVPYLRAWDAKYREAGLIIVGVHTPEFEFEKRVDNVRREVANFDIDYPVALDPDYAVWRAFRNHFWPAIYVADHLGQIRFHRFGEGEYERIEAVIQQLLRDAGRRQVPGGVVEVEGKGAEAPADWADLRTPETYLGHARSKNLHSGNGVVNNVRRNFERPGRLGLNQWALVGEWSIGKTAARSATAGGRIAFRFSARDLHLVMGPRNGEPVRFRVSLDGNPPGENHGGDVAPDGAGTSENQRMYQLIRQTGRIEEREFEIEFLDPGIEAYAFTFG